METTFVMLLLLCLTKSRHNRDDTRGKDSQHLNTTLFMMTEAVVLVDASNAFNQLNRQLALRNISVLCPSLACFVINIYRANAPLFVGGEVIYSREGTTVREIHWPWQYLPLQYGHSSIDSLLPR